MRITLVRHGRTADNHGRIWQGWAGRGLDDVGHDQAAKLAQRLTGRTFDRVISSDIQRVVETASHLNRAIELDSAWREIDVGSWAGRSIPETFEEHRDEFMSMYEGADIRIGGDGESTHEFHARVVGAFERLIAEHDAGDEVLVVAHGGVIGSIAAELFGATWPGTPTAPITNTALTTIEITPRGPRLAVLNDGSHLGDLPGFAEGRKAEGDRVVTFVRHGQTDGNLEDRWMGHSCNGLNETGHSQAGLLAEHMGARPNLWSSDVQRARETAERIGDPNLTEGLREVYFGSWEGLTNAEVMDRDPDFARRIYQDREDLPRGGDGESWEMLTKRVVSTVDGILAESDDDVTLVSHGSAIRSWLLDAMDLGWDSSPKLGLLPNTGYARVVKSPWRWQIFDYGVAPHLGVQPGR